MKKIFLLSLFLLLLFLPKIHSQTNFSFPPNTYRTSENPYYWKNKKPSADYWQQDVYYKIKATLNDSTDIVDGSEDLTYWNNSPDTLAFVFFHLYQDAFQPNSYYANLSKNNGQKLSFGRYEKEKLGLVVSKITINGIELKTETDNTIMKALLLTPLKTGGSVTFHIEFKTYFDHGTMRRRMKSFNAFGYKQYDLVHWYPRIAVYDRKFGWQTDQHLGHEFYGDFGTFDAEISFPNNYIVGATGTLLNEKEMYPGDLREKLDIKNFKDKPWESAPSEIIKPDGTYKTWKFHAENVFDFALVADPTFRIGEVDWHGIKCIALAQEQHASGWQNAAEFTAKVIQTNSESIGMYAYPKMIVADARDGMEYPMLTLDGGFDPSYRSLLAHEISHNWFFAMVSNNETYRAALDEGFTQFMTSWDLEHIDGLHDIQNPEKSAYVNRYRDSTLVRNTNVYNGYMFNNIFGFPVTLNTHSDDFNGAVAHGGGYSQVYFKTATMLYNLQYVLGDSLFLKAMQHYFNQWKFCHPYLMDFRNSVINYTHVDLNWFFDEWMTTTKTIDYAVSSVKKGKSPNQYIITFKRKGEMQMPIDFDVINNNDSVFHFYIPNTWFTKKTKAIVLKHWIGWGTKIEPTYQATVTIPNGIADVQIDPSHRLADVYMLDNSYKKPVKSAFDSKIYNTPDWTKYTFLARPDAWYNNYDGLKAGLHLHGDYLNYYHVFDATFWFNTGMFQRQVSDSGINKFDKISFTLSYKTATDNFMPHSDVFLSAKVLDGLNAAKIGFEKKDNSLKNRVYVYFKTMYRPSEYSLNYLLDPQEWEVQKFNNTLNFGIEHTYNTHGYSGTIIAELKASALTNDYNYSNLNITNINKKNIWKLKLLTRLIAQYGMGTNTPDESALYLAGANPEEMMDDKFTRSAGAFSQSMAGFGSSMGPFQAGGGLNLRGYADYLAPEMDKNGNIVYTYKGTSGAAVNAELEFNNVVKFNPRFLKNYFHLATYLFGDAGFINDNEIQNTLAFGNLRADAGVGTALTIQRWGPLQTVYPLTIRFDMPLFLNHPPATDQGFFQFRWIIAVERAF